MFSQSPYTSRVLSQENSHSIAPNTTMQSNQEPTNPQDEEGQMNPLLEYLANTILDRDRRLLFTAPDRARAAKAYLSQPTENEAILAARKSANLPLTPLEELEITVHSFFDKDPDTASLRFTAIGDAVMMGSTWVYPSISRFSARSLIPRIPWDSSRLAATLILVLAAPAEAKAMNKALNYLSRKTGAFPSVKTVSRVASADFAKRFAKAKQDAVNGKVGKVTVLAVQLVDVATLRREEKGHINLRQTSFAHAFTVVLGREGWRVYQAWGGEGYRLDEYVARGDSRLRTWEEGKRFVKQFSKLANYTGMAWTPALYSAYKECFHVDLEAICGKGKPLGPVIPVFCPWVRIYEICDVQVEHITKFEWKGFM